MIMKQLYKLSKTLQDPNLSALESYELAKMTVNTLKLDRNDTSFELLNDRLEQLQKCFNTDEATVDLARSQIMVQQQPPTSLFLQERCRNQCILKL